MTFAQNVYTILMSDRVQIEGLETLDLPDPVVRALPNMIS